MLRYFSTFSGIGGLELGIERAFSHRQPAKVGRQGQNKVLSRDSTDTQQHDVQGHVLCVGYSEIDKYATQIYQSHFDHKNYGDITAINAESLPNFDLYVGGFPCQAFSIAGKRAGFEDTRGTLFFDVARILKAKRPKHFLLENVKGLLSHDNGRTFKVIISTLVELGYGVEWQVLNSKDFGVPQNRERVFIVGHFGGDCGPQVFPLEADDRQDFGVQGQYTNTLTARYEGAQAVGSYIAEGQLDAQIGTLRTHKDGQGFRRVKSGLAPTIPARAREDGSGQPVVAYKIRTENKDGEGFIHPWAGTLRAGASKNNNLVIRQRARGKNKGGEHDIAPTMTGKSYQDNNAVGGVRRLTPVECERLQGFPDGWTEGVSDTQRYKTLGNAVTVNVIQAIMEKLYGLEQHL